VAVRDILLDTNAYVAFKRGIPDAVDVLRYAPRIGMSSIFERQGCIEHTHL
jgi:hypothetical protein